MDSNKRYLTSSFKGYFKPEAKELFEKLTEAGLDPDLAVVLLEASGPDIDIYEIPEDE